MPICPKCHNIISEKKWERHTRRCGTKHKHEPVPLYVPSATPPWESVERGIVVGPRSKFLSKKGWVFWLLVLVVAGLVLGPMVYFWLSRLL